MCTCGFSRRKKFFGKFSVFVERIGAFLRLIYEAKGKWAKMENKEFMNFPFSCSLISRGMVKCHCMRKALCAQGRGGSAPNTNTKG